MPEYSDLIARAIAKEKGLPYQPLDMSSNAPVGVAPEMDATAAGAALAPQANTFEAQPASPPTPVELPAEMPTAPAPVAAEVTGAAPAYGPLVAQAIAKDNRQRGVTSPAPEETKPPVRIVEPKATEPTAETAPAETKPAAAELADPEAEKPRAELSALSLEPSVPSAQKDAAAIVADTEAANDRIAEAEGDAAKERAEKGRKFLGEFDALTREHGDQEKAALAGIKKLADDYGAMNDEIAKLPPISDRRSGFKKFLGGVGVGLGQMVDQNNLVAGLMQGMNVQTHNAESIQNQINAAVDRDIAIQRENLNNKRKSADAKLNELEIAKQYLGDTRQANRFALALRKDRYGAEMDVAADELASETARDRGRLAALKLRSDARKEMNDILQTELGSKAAAFQAIAAGRMTAEQAKDLIGGASASDGSVPTVAEAKGAKRSSEVNKSQEQLAQGYHAAGSKLAPEVYVADEEIWNRKKTEEKQKELNVDFQSRELRRQLSGLRDYIAANPDYATNIDKRATLESKRTSILTTFKDAKELGALDNGVERVVGKAIGNPNGPLDSMLSFFGKQPSAVATLDEQIRETDAAINARRSNNGLGNTPPPKPEAAEEKPTKPAPAKPEQPAASTAQPSAPTKPTVKRLSPEDL